MPFMEYCLYIIRCCVIILVAGYATVYDASGVTTTDSSILGAYGNSFTFVTVKGGRHEVPETAPAQALDMLSRLLGNTGF